MTCAALFDDVLKELARLQSGALTSQTAPLFRAQIVQSLIRIEKRARVRTPPFAPDQVSDCKFAVVALADEAALRNTHKKLSGDWKDGKNRKLAHELFGEVDAGIEFYKRLERWRRIGSADAASVLEVFCLCLFMDYRGKMTNDAERMDYAKSVREEIRLIRSNPILHVGQSRLAARPVGDPPVDWTRRFAFWSVSLCAAAFVFYRTYVWLKLNSVVSQAEEYVRK